MQVRLADQAPQTKKVVPEARGQTSRRTVRTEKTSR